MTTVREVSRAGPCITLGTLVRKTASTLYYRDRLNVVSHRSGRAVECGLVHTLPCRSCRDHPNTSYPDGYMD